MKTLTIFTLSGLLYVADLAMLKLTAGTLESCVWGALLCSAVLLTLASGVALLNNREGVSK
jgi:hypothetical protein